MNIDRCRAWGLSAALSLDPSEEVPELVLVGACHACALMLEVAVCETKLVTKHVARAGLCPRAALPPAPVTRRDMSRNTPTGDRSAAPLPSRGCRRLAWPGTRRCRLRWWPPLAAQAAGRVGDAEANGQPLRPSNPSRQQAAPVAGPWGADAARLAKAGRKPEAWWLAVVGGALGLWRGKVARCPEF
jgi:hypothetical protein